MIQLWTFNISLIVIWNMGMKFPSERVWDFLQSAWQSRKRIGSASSRGPINYHSFVWWSSIRCNNLCLNYIKMSFSLNLIFRFSWWQIISVFLGACNCSLYIWSILRLLIRQSFTINYGMTYGINIIQMNENYARTERLQEKFSWKVKFSKMPMKWRGREFGGEIKNRINKKKQKNKSAKKTEKSSQWQTVFVFLFLSFSEMVWK